MPSAEKNTDPSNLNFDPSKEYIRGVDTFLTSLEERVKSVDLKEKRGPIEKEMEVLGTEIRHRLAVLLEKPNAYKKRLFTEEREDGRKIKKHEFTLEDGPLESFVLEVIPILERMSSLAEMVSVFEKLQSEIERIKKMVISFYQTRQITVGKNIEKLEKVLPESLSLTEKTKREKRLKEYYAERAKNQSEIEGANRKVAELQDKSREIIEKTGSALFSSIVKEALNELKMAPTDFHQKLRNILLRPQIIAEAVKTEAETESGDQKPFKIDKKIFAFLAILMTTTSGTIHYLHQKNQSRESISEKSELVAESDYKKIADLIQTPSHKPIMTYDPVEGGVDPFDAPGGSLDDMDLETWKKEVQGNTFVKTHMPKELYQKIETLGTKKEAEDLISLWFEILNVESILEPVLEVSLFTQDNIPELGNQWIGGYFGEGFVNKLADLGDVRMFLSYMSEDGSTGTDQMTPMDGRHFIFDRASLCDRKGISLNAVIYIPGFRIRNAFRYLNPASVIPLYKDACGPDNKLDTDPSVQMDLIMVGLINTFNKNRGVLMGDPRSRTLEMKLYEAQMNLHRGSIGTQQLNEAKTVVREATELFNSFKIEIQDIPTGLKTK